MFSFLKATYTLRAIIFRALSELDKTAKPWPTNVKRARNALVRAQKGITEAYFDIPEDVRQAAFDAWFEEKYADAVVRPRPTRDDVRDE